MAAATASFTFPPHPSATKIHGPASILPTASGPYAALKIDTDTAGIATPLTPSSHKEHEGRNPHDLPSFTSEGLAHPSSPVLYLPPLLSKLPPKYPDFDPFPSSSSLSPSSSSPSSSFPLSSPTQLPSALITETRLPDIDPASLSLHKALHKFRPIDSNYAGTPYAEAFNWSELELSEDEEREWYVVAFRSKRKAGSDGEPLYEADAKAHAEAVQNGGLIMYWYGIPNTETGMNLATCIWQSRKHAVAANSRPHHIKAMRLAAAAYDVYRLERYVLRKRLGERHVIVEDFHAGEVGW